jgi:hypothetical protein
MTTLNPDYHYRKRYAINIRKKINIKNNWEKSLFNLLKIPLEKNSMKILFIITIKLDQNGN